MSVMHLNLPRDVLDEIDAEAKTESRTRANMALVLLREALQVRIEAKPIKRRERTSS